MNRRNFLKACGVGVVAPLGLVGKATASPEPRQTSMTCSENKHGYDYVIYDNDTGEKVSEGFIPYPEYYAPVKQLTLAETKKLFPKFREV